MSSTYQNGKDTENIIGMPCFAAEYISYILPLLNSSLVLLFITISSVNTCSSSFVLLLELSQSPRPSFNLNKVQ